MFRTLLVLLVVGAAVSASLAQSSDAVSQAKRQVSQADSERHKAIIALSKEAARIRKQIEAAPDWLQAEAALKDGKAKYANAVNAVRRSLQADPGYRKAQASYRAALEAKESLRDKADATPDQRTEAATACLAAASEVGRIEQKAIANDSAADQAHNLIQQSMDQIEELKKRFASVAQKDSGYQAARQHLSSAETQLASAESNLSQAKAAQARAVEEKSNQEIDALSRTMMRNAGVSR